MAQINVTIAGRVYRMACEDGQESHLASLAKLFDERIGDMRTGFGEIGDMRLHVMAAITLADELSENRRKIAALEGELARRRATSDDGDSRIAALRSEVASAINDAAARLERLAAALNPKR